jgi:Domain of unknown function (DUF4136)
MRIARIFLGIAMMGAIVNVAAAQKVTVYDVRANFARYRTFSWIEPPNTSDPAIRAWLVEAIDSALATKGLQRVRTDGDLGIAAHVATPQAQTLPAFYNGVAGGWRWLSGFEATTPAQVYDVGTLVVDLFDRQTRNVMWRGCSPKALSVNPGESADKLSAAISQMFTNFPPPSLTPDTAVIR